MTAITFNGEDTYAGTLTEPRIGVWRCQCEIRADRVADAPPTGAAIISFPGKLSLTGTVLQARSVNDNGKVTVWVEGGSSKTDRPLTAQHFRSTTVGALLRDMAVLTGDTLSPTISSSVLSHAVAFWTRPETIGYRYLSDIADELGAAWRILRDGTLWLGEETWPTVSPQGVETVKIPWENGLILETLEDGPVVTPGTTLNGKRVAEVVTTWNSKNLKQHALFEDHEPRRHTRSIAAQDDWFMRRRGTQLDLSALYPCRVLAQSGDKLTADVMPDDKSVRAQGLQGVKIRYSLPGVTATLKPGARALLGWDAHDPTRPFVGVFEFAGISELQVAPEGDADVRIKATGAGVVRLESDSRVTIDAPSVVLNGGAAANARLGDLVAGKCELMVAQMPNPAGVPPFLPLPVVSASSFVLLGGATAPLAPEKGKTIAQIISGKGSVVS